MMNQILLRLQAACAKHRRRTSIVRRHILEPESGFFVLWNYEHRLAYCPNAKTGTSTWMHVLLGLVPWLPSSSATQDDDWRGRFHAAAQRLFQMPMKWPAGRELFDLLFSFVFVRHPFVRLVSAYQDKVLLMLQMLSNNLIIVS